MNIHKHMEAIFVVTLAIIGVGEFVFDSLPDAAAQTTVEPAHAVAKPAPMQVVVIHAPARTARHV